MRSFASLLVLAIATASCGGDDDGNDDGGSTLTAGASTSSGGDASSSGASSGSAESSSDDGSTSSGAADSSSGAADSSSGEGPEDPSYPRPDDGGACPNDTAPIMLGGGSVCAPFCAGAEAACPAPSTGDAMPVCTPFEQAGGSGTACTEHTDCPAEEACGIADTCVAVAFWGCRLECAGGETCSDGMTCAMGACAYP